MANYPNWSFYQHAEIVYFRDEYFCFYCLWMFFFFWGGGLKYFYNHLTLTPPSTTGAISYVELGTLVSQSGGEYAYFLHGFASGERRKSWFAPIPAFLFSWVSVFLLKPSGLAIICLTCSEYFTKVFNIGTVGCLTPDVVVKLFAAATISNKFFLSLSVTSNWWWVNLKEE